MINDEMLAQAAYEAAMKQLDALPHPEQCQHQFSSKFERRIRKLTRKVKHPAIYRVVRMAACFLLMFSFGFGCILAISSDVRAATYGWIQEKVEAFYQYFFDGEVISQVPANFYPDWLPDGYSQNNENSTSGGKSYVFTNENGDVLVFSYSTGKDHSMLYITDDCAQSATIINGHHADIYAANKAGESSIIVWKDTSRNILFYVSANARIDDLIKIAENINEK